MKLSAFIFTVFVWLKFNMFFNGLLIVKSQVGCRYSIIRRWRDTGQTQRKLLGYNQHISQLCKFLSVICCASSASYPNFYWIVFELGPQNILLAGILWVLSTFTLSRFLLSHMWLQVSSTLHCWSPNSM